MGVGAYANATTPTIAHIAKLGVHFTFRRQTFFVHFIFRRQMIYGVSMATFAKLFYVTFGLNQFLNCVALNKTKNHSNLM